MAKPGFHLQPSDFAKVAVLALAYAVTVRFVLAHLTADGIISIVWIPSGLGFAAVLAGGKKYWPGILAGAFAAYMLTDRPVGLSVLFALSNTLEPLLGLWLLSRKARFDPSLRSVSDFSALAGAGAACAGVAALVGVFSLLAVGGLPPGEFVRAYRIWWMGNFLGIMVATPLLLVWRKPPLGWLKPGRLLETLAFLGLSVLCGQAVFFNWFHDWLGKVALGYWVFLFVAWGAVRFGRHGALYVIGLVVMQALLSALWGVGLFSGDIAATGLANFWLYILILTVVGLSLALVIEGRDTALAVARSAQQETSLWLRNAEQSRQRLLSALEDQKMSEERFRGLVEVLTGDLVFIRHDAEGLLDYVSPSIREVLGYAQEELVGRNFGSLQTDHPDNTRIIGFAEPVAAGKRRAPYELEVWGKDGLRHWLWVSETSLRDAQGKILWTQGVVRDITEEKKTQERLRAIVDTEPACVKILARDGTLLAMNCAGLAMIEVEKEEDVVGRKVSDLILPEYREAFWQFHQRVCAGQAGALQFEIIGMKGGRKWLESHAVPLAGDYGSPASNLSITLDITERKRVEDQLRKLAQAVEQSSGSIAITNLDARMEYVNEAFVQNTGYGREEVIGQNPRMLHSNKTPPETYRALWEALTQGCRWEGEFINRRKDGSEYVEFAIITPLRQPDGRITHYVAVKEDITEKKRLAEELNRHRHHLEELVESRTLQLAEACERAEVANRAKSAFLANMSHEIRTPMNAIVGLTHLLRRDGSNPEQTERLGKIDTAAHHLLHIINDVLDLSKIEAGKLDLAQTDFELAPLLRNACALVHDKAEIKGLKLRVDAGNLPPVLHGDSTRLSQALLNYLSNAVKFTDHGDICLRCSVVEESDNDLLLRFEVRDTGIGISQDKLGRLFMAFEQADNSTSRKYGGTGLGLALTRKLARLMGGEAGADSTEGIGSTFWFTVRLGKSYRLPAHPPVALGGKTTAKEALARDYRGMRVLLAEDDPVNQEVARELLDEAGLEVDVVDDGRQAVERVRGGAYALVLMDMQMPVMDGLAAARAIRQLPEQATLPILAMTANVFEEDRKRCLEVGMDGHIAKPVDPAALYAALLRWLPPPTQPSPLSVSPAAPLDDAALRQALASIPGLDVESGLKNLLGKLPRYVRVLGLFVQGHADDIAVLRRHLDAGAQEEAWCAAHTLKGLAATLGAESLRQKALDLEMALKQGEAPKHIETCLAAVEAELAPLLAALRRVGLDGGRSALPSAKVDWVRAKATLQHLEALLADDDSHSNVVWRESAALLEVALGSACAPLRRAIEDYDYEQALRLLRAAAANLGLGLDRSS